MERQRCWAQEHGNLTLEAAEYALTIFNQLQAHSITDEEYVQQQDHNTDETMRVWRYPRWSSILKALQLKYKEQRQQWELIL